MIHANNFRASAGRRARGATLIETALTLASALALLAICCIGLGAQDAKHDAPGQGVRTSARTTADAVYLTQIHKAIVVFARQFEGVYPRPGLIDRLPIALSGGLQEVPGRGAEDVAQNTTARLYSSMIMQNYFNPDLCVSPVERNPRVEVDADYDWERYNPSQDSYWDEAFVADLADRSNASYAHLVMHGQRMIRAWRDTADAKSVVLGNRGPLAGEPDGASFTCGPHGHWAGNLVFGDGRVELLTTMTPRGIVCAVADDESGVVESRPDNVFAMETGPDGADMILSFTRHMTAKGPALQHD